MDLVSKIDNIISTLANSIPEGNVRKQVEHVKMIILNTINESCMLPVSHVIESMKMIDIELKDGVLCMEPSS